MSRRGERTLEGWGRLPVPGCEVVSEDLERITRDLPLTRGLGRSYGDSSLPPPGRPRVAGSRLADRLLGFDPASGALRAEAGLALGVLSRLFWPRGWTAPVLTGTQFVTLGGMVAADVHGKNHHRDGTFGAHVRALRVHLADGEVVECSRQERRDLFLATLGGMGLTGHILEVELEMKPIPSAWVWCESERIDNLQDFLEGLAEAARSWPFTVGWIDALARGRRMGRGLLIRGRWAEAGEGPDRPPAAKRQVTVPFDAPGWTLNPVSVRMFNAVYYRRQWARVRRGTVHPEAFFHPLDSLRHWNRIYGRHGFTQYQCVIPKRAGAAAVRRFLELVVELGAASFLSVIKDCGAEGEGLLSFPMSGTTLALDLPVRPGTQLWVDRLNERLIEEGGRIYLAKDAFTRAEHLRAMEGERLARFLEVRRRWDPEGRLASAQSVRLLGDLGEDVVGSGLRASDGDAPGGPR